MKRTELNRKTHLRWNPTKNMNARKPMPRVTKNKKRRTIRAKADKERGEFVRATSRCHICNTNTPTDCHEIIRGSNRFRAIQIPAAWLAVCRFPCHEELDSASKWPLVAQLAVKKIRQPNEYDRIAVLRAMVFGGDPTRMDNSITEYEVDKWVDELKKRPEFGKMNEPQRCYQHRSAALTTLANKEQGHG